MKIEFKHFDQLSDMQEDYIIKKIENLQKYFPKSEIDEIFARIIFEKNKHHHSGNIFEIKVELYAPHYDCFYTQLAGETPESCIDNIHEKLERQIEKEIGKRKEHHATIKAL